MSRAVPAAMGRERRVRRLLRLGPLLSVLSLGACASVLGIEDVHDGPNPGGGGDTGSGATSSGGKSNNAGTMNTPVGGEDSGLGGGGSVIGGIGNTPGGSPSEAGAGGGVSDDPTVHGRLIDFWSAALPNVSVQIGADLVTTDDNGEFIVENVPPEYDVSLLLKPEGREYAWVFQGLTRRNPTLQVYVGRTQRSGSTLLKATNITLGVNDNLSVSIGTPDTTQDVNEISTAPEGDSDSADWFGAQTTQGTAHALVWTRNAGTLLPTNYRAYNATTVGLSETQSATLTFDLTPAALPMGNVVGTATPVADGDRNNGVYVRFNSGGSIQIVDDTPTTNAFSYVVPTVPNIGITVMAMEGYYAGPLGLAHRDGLGPGSTDVDLQIPAPAEPLTPAGGAADAVTQDTPFSFKASPDNAGAFVITLENFDFYQTLYIVTSSKAFKIPTVLDGAFTLDANQFFRWWVETHGDYATVDEMTSSVGYIDEFCVPPYYAAGNFDSYMAPAGQNQTDGNYTLSAKYGFTTAP